ncbi:hypothetical protein F383_26553 [Gossypium arboreum]|uniref:Uncharacterized protein n=1 Tax=Gossypium arboreum TaxID=29729 RepID=A0A0B0MMN9_GOSAR|nr:hypothetical protein F383_26553 [Gossypium arboreum]
MYVYNQFNQNEPSYMAKYHIKPLTITSQSIWPNS